MSARKPTRPGEEPSGLSVDLLRVGDDELAVFTLEAPSPSTDALTQAEREVLARVIAGDSNAAIAAARNTSARTVANQVARLLRKLGASSRFDLIRRFGSADVRTREKG